MALGWTQPLNRNEYRENEIYTLLGNYAAYTGNSLPVFLDSLSSPIFSVSEEGANKLSRSISKELPLYAV
jgi:hypothetical protein